MSSLVLMHRDGTLAHKLQLISLPDDYIVPEGMIVSWRTVLHLSYRTVAGIFSPQEPTEAFFYLGNAQGQICRDRFQESERVDHQLMFGSRNLTVTVQGTSAKDVMRMRDHIMQLIHSGTRWNVRNDLNPRPRKSFLQLIKNMLKVK